MNACIVCAVFLLVLPGLASAGIIVNGGFEPNGNSWISQRIGVIAPGTSLIYDYWTQTTDNIYWGWQDVYVQDASYKWVATLQHEDTTHGWVHRVFDLSPYAGTDARITFLVHQDAAGDLTSMYVDNVQLTPEPGTAFLLLSGLAAAGLILPRKKK